MAWQRLYFYWRDHHKNGQPPSRADIDPPLEIPRLLPNLMLFKVESIGFRTRLAGSELTRRSGFDATGNILDPSRSTNPRAKEFEAFLRKVTETGAPVLYRVGQSNRNSVGAMVILLPLMDTAGSVEMVLGGVFYDPDITRDPTLKWEAGDFKELALADELARDRETRQVL